jgi:hypothetical protein
MGVRVSTQNALSELTIAHRPCRRCQTFDHGCVQNRFRALGSLGNAHRGEDRFRFCTEHSAWSIGRGFWSPDAPAAQLQLSEARGGMLSFDEPCQSIR